MLRYVQDAVDQVLGRLTLQSLLRTEHEMAVAMGPRAVALADVDRLADRP